MPRGGARPGAGRPKGRKDTQPRRWHAASLSEGPPETRREFVETCREVCSSGQASAHLLEMLNSSDVSRRDRGFVIALSYGIGLPVQRHEEVASTERLVIELEETRERLAAEQLALEAGQLEESEDA